METEDQQPTKVDRVKGHRWLSMHVKYEVSIFYVSNVIVNVELTIVRTTSRQTNRYDKKIKSSTVLLSENDNKSKQYERLFSELCQWKNVLSSAVWNIDI